MIVKLRNKINIENHVTGIDENGYPCEEWQELARVWSAKRGLSGREYYAAAAVESETDVVFTVRYNSITIQITPEMRIIEGTDTENPYNIKSVVDKDGLKRWLEIRASR